MDREKSDDLALDALFGAARDATPDPSVGFLSRLEADADMLLPRQTQPIQVVRTPLMTRLGGLFVATGLSGAAALGVWIGFAMPDLLNLDTFVSTVDESVGLYAFLPGADVTALGE